MSHINHYYMEILFKCPNPFYLMGNTRLALQNNEIESALYTLSQKWTCMHPDITSKITKIIKYNNWES